MLLRWLVTEYPEPTRERVESLWVSGHSSRQECYSKLKEPNTKVLQYWTGSSWEDVPTVVMEEK